MTTVLTLVAPGALSDDQVTALTRELPDVAATRRLGDRAVDIEVEASPSAVRSFAQSGLADKGLDIAVGTQETRRKSVLVCDMDSTIIGQECLDELADVAGIGAEIAAITERAMRGELDFEEALRDRVAQLKGLPAKTIQEVIATRLSLNAGAETLVKTMRKHGAFTALVSGGFTPFTAAIAKQAGFSAHRGNTLEVDEQGLLTGNVVPPILGKEAKRDALVSFCSEQGVAPSAAVAIGDGANDLAMIELAGLGVAYRAKPVVAAAADAAIKHTDLRSVLYFQGYCDSEIDA